MMPVLMTITPSLNGFFIGLLSGAVVLGAIAGGLIFISLVGSLARLTRLATCGAMSV
jgi:photosystem II PsbX protein